jgi:subtilisin family serine protease
VYNPTLNVWRIDAGTAAAAGDLADILRADPDVEFVQPQYRYTNASEPTDDLYLSQQHVHDRVINVPVAWDLGVPANEVTVAVIDGGVDVAHPDLDSRIWTNPADAPGNRIDDDGNGCVDDVTGCSFLFEPPDGDVHDVDGHGTFVSGLIAAEWDGAGVAGIAQNAVIMPVRALDPAGAGDSEQLSEAILYSARNGADLINMSLALVPEAGVCPRDDLMEEALREAVETYDALVIAVSGNDSIGCVSYPGSSDYAMAVAASGPAENSDERAEFSQYGPEVDVAAPGVGVLSTCPVPTDRPLPNGYCRGLAYGFGDGTSFSAPIVTAVAALVLGHEPHLTREEVTQRLKDTARNVPDNGRLNWDGAGIVDAGAAVGAGSTFSSLDVRGHRLDDLTATVIVGDAASPECAAVIWGRATFAAKSVGSTLGVGECADYWPPSPSRPWSLVTESAGGKGLTVNTWSVSANDLACSVPGGPRFLAPGQTTELTLDCEETAQIANDDIAGAMVVDDPSPRRYEQDVRYATSVDDPPASCTEGLGYSRSVWYRIPPANQRPLAVDTAGSSFNTALAVYSRNGAGDLVQVGCNNDLAAIRGETRSRVAWVADGSVEYLVMAAAAGGAPAHRLRLNFSTAHIPENDTVSAPVELSPEDVHPYVQSAHSTTSDPSDPALSCSPSYEASLWFSVTAENATPLTVSTAGSTYDTVLGVFEAGPSGLREVACNDQAGPNDNTSRATWTPEPGRAYLIVVGSYLLPGSPETIRPPGVLKIAVSGQ